MLIGAILKTVPLHYYLMFPFSLRVTFQKIPVLIVLVFELIMYLDTVVLNTMMITCPKNYSLMKVNLGLES